MHIIYAVHVFKIIYKIYKLKFLRNMKINPRLTYRMIKKTLKLYNDTPKTKFHSLLKDSVLVKTKCSLPE